MTPPEELENGTNTKDRDQNTKRIRTETTPLPGPTHHHKWGPRQHRWDPQQTTSGTYTQTQVGPTATTSRTHEVNNTRPQIQEFIKLCNYKGNEFSGVTDIFLDILG